MSYLEDLLQYIDILGVYTIKRCHFLTIPFDNARLHPINKSTRISVVPVRTLRIDINPLSRIFDIRHRRSICADALDMLTA